MNSFPLGKTNKDEFAMCTANTNEVYTGRITRLTLTLLLAMLCGCGTGQPKAGKTTVRLATTRGSLMFFPVHVARSLGYYDEEGVDLIIDETASAPKSMQALLGGSSDMVGGGFTSVVMMHAARRPVQAFLLLVRDPGYVALVSPRATRPIKKIEDLHGATVGVSSLQVLTSI